MKSFLLTIFCAGLAVLFGCDRGPSSHGADNTSNNARDRGGRTVTPEDQSNSAADLALTKKVRQSLIDESSYSIDAKNIKVITQGGKVTLRGVVDNGQERDSIVAKVKSLPGVADCDDQLEVKSH